MKQFNHRQPDKGGIKGSAKATISLPLAQPTSNSTTNKSPSENSLNSQVNTEDTKGSVRRLLYPNLIFVSSANTAQS
jgi:hypothetical protein